MYKKILLPLDGSEFSAHVLEHLIKVAGSQRASKVVLFHVVEPVILSYGPQAIEVALELKKKAIADAKGYLAAVANDLKKKGLSVETLVNEGSYPADEIMDYAEKNGVDLIIMSTHGRSGISRWFFGSVAEKVIRHSTIPVLISPPVGSRGRK